jgi:hypothetical protein
MVTKVKTRFIVDSKGRKREVVLPIADFRAMVREIEDLRDAQFVDEAEASAEGFVKLDDLRRDQALQA